VRGIISGFRLRVFVAASMLAIIATPCAHAIAADPARSASRDVCHESFGDDAEGRWIASIFKALCDGDANSKFAAYMLSVPPIEGTHAQRDQALFSRAIDSAGKRDAMVFYFATLGAPPQCLDHSTALAKRLTDADPGNGYAWLTRAYAADACGDDESETLSSLGAAARSNRFHDYAFDFAKLVAMRLARIPVPADVVAANHFETPDQVRFALLTQLVLSGMSWESPVIAWFASSCTEGVPPPDEGVRVACGEIRHRLATRGDSVALLAVDPERQRSAIANIEAVLGSGRTPKSAGATVLMRTLVQSRSETEFYRKALPPIQK
jgi:hypothetical protein